MDMQKTSSVTQFRVGRLLIGGLLLCWPPMWFRLAERGAFHDLPRWAVWPLVLSLLGSILGGIAFVGNGLGLLTSDVLAEGDLGRAPKLRTFLTVYVGAMVLMGAGALLANTFLAIHWMRGTSIGCGALFLLAASRRPWWIYATVRRVGWFSHIESDRVLCTLLSAIGGGALLVGILAPNYPVR
jgi:hypothetical protein